MLQKVQTFTDAQKKSRFLSKPDDQGDDLSFGKHVNTFL